MNPGFKEIKKIKDEIFFIFMGNKALIERIGTYALKLQDNKVFFLKDCLYIPSIKSNLLSVYCLAKFGFSFFFRNEKFVMYRVLVYALGANCMILDHYQRNGNL